MTGETCLELKIFNLSSKQIHVLDNDHPVNTGVNTGVTSVGESLGSVTDVLTCFQVRTKQELSNVQESLTRKKRSAS